MSLRDWVQDGWLTKHKSSREEIKNLLGLVERDLAYRLYNISDRKKWSQEALAYNSPVVAWPESTRLAHA